MGRIQYASYQGENAAFDNFALRQYKEERAKNEKIKGLWVVITTHKTGQMKSEEMSYADAVSYINNKSKRNVNIASTSRLGQFMPIYSINKVEPDK